MEEKIIIDDKFPKDSIVERQVGLITNVLGRLKGSGSELAVLGIVVGLVLNKGENFVLACICLTFLGALTKYAEITSEKKQVAVESRSQRVGSKESRKSPARD